MQHPERTYKTTGKRLLQVAGLWFALGLLAACSSATRVSPWQAAESANTVEAYQAYVLGNPDGEHLLHAQERLEAMSWEAATQANDYDIYRRFRASFPDSRHRAEVIDRIERIEWEDALSDSTEASLNRFIAAFPGNQHVPEAREKLKAYVETRRAALEHERMQRLEREGSQALVAMGPSASLEEWEAFGRKYAETMHRVQAGKAIERLSGSARMKEINRRKAPYLAKSLEENTRPIFVVDAFVSDELEDPRAAAALLIKESDYSYLAVSERGVLPSRVALDQTILRQAGPREAVVLQLNEKLLKEAPRRLNQAVTNAWEELVRHDDVEFTTTRVIILGPIDRLVPDPKAPGGRWDRNGDETTFYLTILFDAEELVEAMPHLASRHQAWSLERLRSSGWTPATPRQAAILAILSEDLKALTEAGPQAEAVALELYAAAHEDGRSRARHAVEHLNPLQAADRLLWAKASHSNTVRSYSEYLDAHPRGESHDVAVERLNAFLTDDTPYEEALAKHNGNDVWRFIQDFPGHRREAEARRFYEGVHIVQLQKENKIEVAVTGSNIETVYVRLRSIVDEPVSVHIPAGMFFAPKNPAKQNMVATAGHHYVLTPYTWKKVYVAAACANRQLGIPNERDEFKLRMHPAQNGFRAVIAALEGASTKVKQAAVWIMTDDASYEDLGILRRGAGPVRPGYRVILQEDTLRAMQVIHNAGVDITSKRIWRDVNHLTNAAEDPSLLQWVESVRQR